MSRSKVKHSYQDYLGKLTKTQIIMILDNFHVDYKAGLKKEEYQALVLQNINTITTYMLDIFQNDELSNIKYLIKHKGVVKADFNYLLVKFLKNLVRLNIVFKSENKEYILPIEFLTSFNKELKKKEWLKKIKQNTHEYSLINGMIDAYGIVDFNYFYRTYSKKYKLQKLDAIKRITNISLFYNEYKIFKDKNNTYLASDMFKSIKDAAHLINTKVNLAVYTLEEYVAINNFTYLSNKKSYKKLVKFIDRNYHIAKGSLKVVNKFLLYPFFKEYQLDKENAFLVLASLIDKYFEFGTSRQKDKFMNLIMNVALEYPRWELFDHSEREKVC